VLNPETFAVQFARALDLFRQQAAKEEQKQQFRLLVGLLQDGGVLLRVTEGRLYVNGTPVDVPQIATLRARLELHGVGEMVVPHDAPVAHVYELLRALSDLPEYDRPLTERLKSTGVDRVSVSLSALDGTAAPLAPPPPRPRPAPSMGTEGLLRGDPMKEYGSSPVAGTGDVVKEEQDVHDAALPTRGSARVDARSYELDQPPAPAAPPRPEQQPPKPDRPPEPERVPPRPEPVPVPEPFPRPDPPPPPPPPRVAAPPESPPAGRRVSRPDISKAAEKDEFAPAAARTTAPGDVLAGLAAHPDAASAADKLAVLSRQVETALQADRIEEALRIVDGIIRLESQVPEGARRTYGIAVKRVLTKSLLQSFAKLAGILQHRDAVLRVLARGGEDGVEILLDHLVKAPTIDERRNLFQAMSQIKQGEEQLTQLLGHHQWFVVRNVAELLGELGLDASIPALGRQLGHEDERVRGAVALALAKIGTSPAVEPLRRAMRDPSPAVRLQVALGVAGRKAGALAMPMVIAIEDEQDPEVARELMLGLGRIGSPDAVQALIKFAQPGGKLFGRKPTSRRLSAVEALRVAATPAAIGTLQGLADDSDKDVRSAARAALAELKR
jgi:HEAT repeat protein